MAGRPKLHWKTLLFRMARAIELFQNQNCSPKKNGSGMKNWICFYTFLGLVIVENYLVLFVVAFVGDILPGAIPNASVPFGIPIAILLRWLLAEWLGLQVSAQLPWWSLMAMGTARGHLERTSLCGN